jgi:GNAT acetyltransferase-like protein
MPVDDRFVTRAYQPGDETAILDLFGRCFHAPRSLEHFRWKYLENPYGNAHISVTFDGDGRLVGHYAGYLVPFVDGSRDLLAHQIGDTMTDPEVRHIGRGPTGILGRTALHFYTTFCDNKIAFNYGFNVSNIQRFSLRFLRADRAEAVAFWRHEGRVPKIGRVGRWLRGYRLELVREAGEEFDRFFADVRPFYPFLVRRDAAYLRWRYLQCPDAGAFIVAIRKWGRLAGWSVFRVREDRLLWGDALFDPRHPSAVDVLLRHVVPGYPVKRVEAWFAPRPLRLAGALRNAGFTPAAEPQDLSVMCVPFVVADATERIRQSLYYTMGDSDLF